MAYLAPPLPPILLKFIIFLVIRDNENSACKTDGNGPEVILIFTYIKLACLRGIFGSKIGIKVAGLVSDLTFISL